MVADTPRFTTLETAVQTADSSNDADKVTFDDLYKLLDSNRTRIRALGTLIASACTFLLTLSLAVLNFIYRGDTRNIPDGVKVFLLLAVASAAVTLGLVVKAILIEPPSSFPTRGKLINDLARIYDREQRWISLAAFGLLITVVCVAIGTGWFGWIAEPKP